MDARTTSLNYISKAMAFVALALCLPPQAWTQQQPASPAKSWLLQTGKVERTIALDHGRLITGQWTDVGRHRDLGSGAQSSELSVTVDGQVITGDGGWKLVSEHRSQQKDRSELLELTVRHGDLEATKSYLAYPGSSIIREWVAFKNAGSEPITLEDPSFLSVSPHLGTLDSTDFLWMTGGENRPGSWLLKTEALNPEKARVFDSYDPFPGVAKSKFEFKMGSATYAPWFALFDKSSKEGLFIGFDYFGRWRARFVPNKDNSVSCVLNLAGYRKTLSPGESITTPKAFTGTFHDDIDNAGNEVLDWQYQYLWDYTRPQWFPAIRMLGFWYNGTSWKDPGNTWVGGDGDTESAYRKVFRVADLMSEVGADVYHRDWGWWDRAGDWNGPDFKTMGRYLEKRNMGQLIYAFLYTVDSRSQLARAHPDWVIKDTLDMSNPAVVAHIEHQLDDFAQRFGPFEWRNDSTPTVPHGKDDTPLLAQDQAFRGILRNFLEKHPEDAFQGVNGGGNDTGYDYARYSSSISFSDGEVGILRNYWASLVLPPDKSSDIPDNWQPDKYDQSSWRGLLTINFDMTGDTWDPAKLEGIRQLIDIYHYLGSQELVGRWVHVYRPAVEGDDPTMYFERLKRDGSQGIIIIKHPTSGPVTVHPKGLNPTQEYLVSFQNANRSDKRLGADLMHAGVRLDGNTAGELIYLNVPYHPGSPLYQTSPSAPASLRLKAAANMGYPGVELQWSASRDDHWVSFYEILRNGEPVDKVAKGTYYFDHSAGADMAAHYSVRAVNGGGLKSPETTSPAAQSHQPPATIIDDADTRGLSFSGNWLHENGLQPAYRTTLTNTDQAGASVLFKVTGSQVTWFTRLCGECGQAEVRIDGKDPSIVDTYSADDIFGVGIYSKTLSGPGPHQVKITVLGKHGGPRGKGTRVYVDGFRIGG